MTETADPPANHDDAPTGSSQVERRAAALDLLTTLTASDDPERAVDSMERRHGALGTFAIDHVLGTLWSRPQLSRRDRSLIVITFLAVLGSDDELRIHLRGAVNHGVERHEIREVVNQVAGYAGYPLAFAATRIVDEVLAELDGVERLPPKEPAPPVDDPDRWVAATDVMGTIFGGRASNDPAEARAGIVAALGGVGELAFDWGFGELWARSELSRRDRSMVTVAILAVLSREAELMVHVPAALNHGVTRVEVEEIMTQLTVYGGFPRAVEGIRAARAAFDRIDARAGGDASSS
ncbi:MAG: carboxymuconolactone decarboxylase family protein [Actinomycetota bacterium]